MNILDRLTRRIERLTARQDRDDLQLTDLKDRVKYLEDMMKFVLRNGMGENPVKVRPEPAVATVIAVDPEGI